MKTLEGVKQEIVNGKYVLQGVDRNGNSIYSNDLFVIIFGDCNVTKKFYAVKADITQYANWKRGQNIQHAMINVPKEDREFLMSGISPDGWLELFPAEDNDIKNK